MCGYFDFIWTCSKRAEDWCDLKRMTAKTSRDLLQGQQKHGGQQRAICLRRTQAGYSDCCTFYLSELTGQPIPIVFTISLLIKTNHPDQSNPKHYAHRRWFSAKHLGKSLFHYQNVWSGHGPASPVPTFGKRPEKDMPGASES